MTLWRLEWLRLIRTRRWIALVAVYLFFGLLGPIGAKYIGEILARFGGGIEVSFPIQFPPMASPSSLAMPDRSASWSALWWRPVRCALTPPLK